MTQPIDMPTPLEYIKESLSLHPFEVLFEYLGLLNRLLHPNFLDFPLTKQYRVCLSFQSTNSKLAQWSAAGLVVYSS